MTKQRQLSAMLGITMMVAAMLGIVMFVSSEVAQAADDSSVIDLGDFTSVSAGTAYKPGSAKTLRGSTIFVHGTFVGTMTIELSHNGTDWMQGKDRASTVISTTSEGIFIIEGDAVAIRANCTAYTSGTISVKLIPVDL